MTRSALLVPSLLGLLLLRLPGSFGQTPAPEASPPKAAPGATAVVVEGFECPSEALGRSVRVRVQLPPGYAESGDRRFPVIYFLHGLFGSERKWEQRGAHRTTDELMRAGKVPAAIIVCPDGGNGFYINARGRSTARYADFLVKELVKAVDGKYRTVADKAGRAMLGDSMGGYGALLNAMRNPEIFGAVASHEASIFPEDRSKLPPWASQGRGNRTPLLAQLFGDPVDEQAWLENNLFHLARTAKDGQFGGLRIYFDVGTNDRYGLDGPTKEWHELLESKKIPHVYHLRDGGHGREFFEDNLPNSLAFLAEALKAARKPAPGG